MDRVGRRKYQHDLIGFHNTTVLWSVCYYCDFTAIATASVLTVNALSPPNAESVPISKFAQREAGGRTRLSPVYL